MRIQPALRAVRTAKGLTLKAVGDQVNTTPQSVSRLESGETTMTLEWLDRICAALEIEPSLLIATESAQAVQACEQATREAMARLLRQTADTIHGILTTLAAETERLGVPEKIAVTVETEAPHQEGDPS